MTLQNNLKKQEALKLREEGLTKPEITKKTGLSRATLTRLFHNHRDIKGGLNEPPETDPINDKNAKPPIKKEVGVSEKGLVSNITGITFHSEDGSIEIIQNEDTPKISAEKTEVEPPEVSAEITEDNSGKTAHTQNLNDVEPEITKPTNMLDGALSTAIPIGLILAGALMKGKLGQKGSFREQEEGSSVW